MIMPVSIITLFLAALVYLTKVSAYLCFCYLFYQLVFRRLPYHNWNRMLILGMAAFSLIAPLLPLSSWPATAPFRDLVNGYLLKTYDRLTGSPAAVRSGAISGQVPTLVWIVVVYGTGLLFATLRFCRDGVRVWRMVYRQNLEEKRDVCSFIRRQSTPPFSN